MFSLKEILKTKLDLSPPVSTRNYLFQECEEDKSLRMRLENLEKLDDVESRFFPHIDGFRFPNSEMQNTLGILGHVEETKGRCGGFCYAALNFFLSSDQQIPDNEREPIIGSWLDSYLGMLTVSSVLNVVPKATELLLNPDPDKISKMRNDCKVGGNTYANLRTLHKHQPCILILIHHEYLQFGKWHQVLAVGCTNNDDQDGALVHIYDPNIPGKECVLKVEDEKIVEYELDCHGNYDNSKPIQERDNNGDLISRTWDAYYIVHTYNYSEPPQASYPVIDLSNQNCISWKPDPSRRGNYIGANLSRANFSNNQSLSGLDFLSSNAQSTNFGSINGIRSSFSFCNLQRAVFDKADLQYSSFVRSSGDNSSFRQAQLNLTNFSSFEGYEVDFSYAKMHYTKMDGATIERANFSFTDISNITFFTEGIYADIGLSPPDISHSDWKYSKITAVTGPDDDETQYCHFSVADLQSADFSFSDISQIKFRICKLSHATFTNAKITNVYFNYCELIDLDFSGATLLNVNFQEMTLEEFDSCNWENTSCTLLWATDPEVQAKLNAL